MARRPRETLMGRDSLVESVLALLREGGRTVTISGPAGIGKTSLARAVAELWGERARVVDAARADEPFAERELRVVDDVGATQPLPSPDPSAALLAITTTPRRRAGELVVHVPPLDVTVGDPDGAAARLWARRAREVDATWRLSPADAGVLGTVLAELDGWPLAIELAVPTARVLGLRELRARLRDFAVHADTLPFAPLTDALARSFEETTERERVGLARLLSFEGAFAPESAERVVDAPWTLELVAMLRDRGWVRTIAEPDGVRFELLRFVRRVVGPRVGALLDADEKRALHERHAHVVLAEPPCPRLVPDLLAVARDPLGRPELAARALVSLDHVAWLREPIPELLPLADRVLADALGPEIEARTLEIRGRLRLRRRELEAAERDLGRALGIARERGDAAMEARALRGLAEHASLADRSEHANELADRALAQTSRGDVGSSPDDAELRASLLRTLGTVRRRAGRALDARAALELASATLPSRGEGDASEPLRGVVLCELAMLELELGRSDVAGDLAARARRVVERHELTYVGAYLQASLAAAHHASGELEEARRAYGAASAFALRAGDERLATIVAAYLATLRVEQGETEARIDLHEIVDELDRMGCPRDAAIVRALFGFLEARAGRLESARALFERVEGGSEGSNRALAIALLRHGAEVTDDEGARARLRAAREAAEREGAAQGGRRDRDGADESVTDLRLALRLTAPLVVGSERDTLVLTREGVIHLPGGRRIDLTTRPLLLRLLRALALRHREQPGELVDVDALLEAGWPGQRMVGSSGTRRLQVAIGRLRESGLREILESEGAGYRLSPRWLVRDHSSTG